MTAAASERPRARVINSVAPIRICDNGGWTDTWFAGHGKVFNIGVYPYVEVQIEVFRRASRSVVYITSISYRCSFFTTDIFQIPQGIRSERAVAAPSPWVKRMNRAIAPASTA